MGDSKVILDASFIINMIGLNPVRIDFSNFEDLISESDRIAPNLVEYEIGSTITTYQKVGGQKDLRIFWNLVWDLDLQLMPLSEPQRVHDLAREYQLSFYDASYLDLLNSESANYLLTLDKKDFGPVSQFDQRIRIFS